ncbi:MAG: type 4a pilus biogenesis protein PilO [bacterium]|nr:type 4a pilus biogenesis protein PilO [bacterium]
MATAVNYREQYARYTRYFRWLRESYGTKPAVKASLELLFTLLIITFFAVFAIRPTAKTVGELFANIKAQQEIASKLDQKLKDLATAQNVLRSEEGRLGLLDQTLPRNPDPGAFLEQIEGLSGSHNATLLSLSIEDATLLGPQERDFMKVAFSVSGSYDSLISLLEDTENLRRVVKIDTISFSQGKGKLSGQLVLAITGKAYYYKGGK